MIRSISLVNMVTKSSTFFTANNDVTVYNDVAGKNNREGVDESYQKNDTIDLPNWMHFPHMRKKKRVHWL